MGPFSFDLPTNNQDGCGFFETLPGEVRDRIYTFALTGDDDTTQLVRFGHREDRLLTMNSTTETHPTGAQTALLLQKSITAYFRLVSASTEKPGSALGPTSFRNFG